MAKTTHLLLSLVIILFFFTRGSSQDFWQRANGPDSASVLSLTVNSSGDIFAGTTKGIFRTTDEGINWHQVYKDSTDIYVWALAINADGFIFAGTGTKGVFRSTDNGDSWEPVINDLANPFFECITFNSQEHIFAGNYSKIFLSTDHGATWVAREVRDGYHSGSTIHSLAINQEGHVFAGTEYGVFRSTDNGTNWSMIFLTLGINANRPVAPTKTRPVRCLNINSEGHIFAGITETSLPIRRSFDGGETWSPIYGAGGLNFFRISIVTHSTGEIFVAFEEGGVYYSTDNGNTWSKLDKGLTATWVLSLAIGPNGHIYAGTENGVFRSIEPLSCPAGKGDLNQDGNRTLLDIGLQMNCVFQNSSRCNYCIGDSNCDWLLSPGDVVALLRNIFLGVPFSC